MRDTNPGSKGGIVLSPIFDPYQAMGMNTKSDTSTARNTVVRAHPPGTWLRSGAGPRLRPQPRTSPAGSAAKGSVAVATDVAASAGEATAGAAGTHDPRSRPRRCPGGDPPSSDGGARSGRSRARITTGRTGPGRRSGTAGPGRRAGEAEAGVGAEPPAPPRGPRRLRRADPNPRQGVPRAAPGSPRSGAASPRPGPRAHVPSREPSPNVRPPGSAPGRRSPRPRAPRPAVTS